MRNHYLLLERDETLANSDGFEPIDNLSCHSGFFCESLIIGCIAVLVHDLVYGCLQVVRDIQCAWPP